ncbi:hypothetical protein L3i22_015510 [Actinoplanes sp. L3-i22]|nr:hypothetical protein L3i22_015510 [Actinoplanes sp. L3-i22]
MRAFTVSAERLTPTATQETRLGRKCCGPGGLDRGRALAVRNKEQQAVRNKEQQAVRQQKAATKQ